MLRRDGQLEVRPGDTALGTGTYRNATLNAFDVVNHNERLWAFGDDSSRGFPSDLFELVNGSQPWRGTANGQVRLPGVTGVRDLGSPVDQDGAVVSCFCAASNGVVVLSYTNSSSTGFVHAFKAADNQTLLYDNLSTKGASDTQHTVKSIVTTTGIFWIIGLGTAGLGGYRYDAAVDEVLPANTALQPTGTGIIAYDCAPTTGGGGGFVTVTAFAGNTSVIRKWNDAGVQQGSDITGPALNMDSLAICGDSGDNRITIAYIRGDNFQCEARVFNLSTGAGVSGPTVLYSAALAFGTISAARRDNTNVVIAAYLTNTTPTGTKVETRTTAALTLSTTETMHDAWLQSQVFFDGTAGNVFAGVLPDSPSSGCNALYSMSLQHQLISKDFGLAGLGSASVSGAPVSSLVRDASTGFYYWANAFVNNDGGLSPQVTEFSLFSTARRQCASLAGLLYISGGCPSVFDGRMTVEQGFTERPRRVGAITSSDSTGQLTAGGRYSYTHTWEWVDAERTIHRSAPSIVNTIQLGATHDTVQYPASTPHSWRCNNFAKTAYGSSVRLNLWRNTCSVTRTAASVTTLPVTPPSASLFPYFLTISVDGGAFQNVIFAPTDITATLIAAAINVQTTGLTATVSGASVVITSDTTGTGSSLLFFPSFALEPILGIVNGQSVHGTQVTQPGPNLQLAATRVIGLSDAYGAPITITDTTSDAVLRTRIGLYTETQTPLSHHAPPPYDYVFPAGDALIAGGLPRRSEWVRSKRLFNAEPVEFAEPGRLNFGGRANGDLKAVAVLDQANTLFSRSEMQVVVGEGPDHSGLGEFFAPDDVPVDGGVADWRALLRTTDGLFFQLDESPSPKLYLMKRGGAAVWIGFAVQDIFDQFPVIVGAAHVKAQQHVCFACNNAAGDAGVILRYDLRRKVWFTHRVSGALRGISSYRGRLAYVLASGVVMLGDATPGIGTFVNYRIRTGSFGGFQSLGYGSLEKVGFLGELRGACTLEFRISYDDAQTFSTLESFSLSGTAGTSITKLKAPRIDRCDRFVLEFIITGPDGSAGLRLNKVVLQVERAPVMTLRGPLDLK